MNLRAPKLVHSELQCDGLTNIQAILAVNNSLISLEYATSYVTDSWDDRMHILINITSCGTLIGQALSKTAFAVTLIKLTKGWYHHALWFCIVSVVECTHCMCDLH
jgi:hypothetical protein